MKPTVNDIIDALRSLEADDYTDEGVARMSAVNAALASNGFSRVKAADRDAAMAMMKVEGVKVTIVSAEMNPVIVNISGVGYYEIHVGEPKVLPESVVEVLRNVPGLKMETI